MNRNQDFIYLAHTAKKASIRSFFGEYITWLYGKLMLQQLNLFLESMTLQKSATLLLISCMNKQILCDTRIDIRKCSMNSLKVLFLSKINLKISGPKTIYNFWEKMMMNHNSWVRLISSDKQDYCQRETSDFGTWSE